jgi:hypothetical protein
VDAACELSQFLTSKRAKVTPEQAGLPTYGQRRVPGCAVCAAMLATPDSA